jgi:SPP1 gp7 family putative phage head morphogenesis protein
MRNDFEQKFTGLRRFWKIPFLFQGTELRTIAVNQRDAEWMATQMLSTKQIMAIYGVPMSVAGFTEDANRSISTSELRFFWGGTIHNRATMVSGIIQERILKVYYPRVLFRYLWEQKFAEVMPEERRSAIASAHVMVTDGIPPVDAYGTVGITLNTEGKPWLETGWMPIGMMPAEDLLEGGGDLLSEGGDGAGEGEGAGVRRRRSRLHRGAWPSSETIRAALWRGMERKRASVERVYLGRWRSFLTWMRDDTIRRIQEADAEKGGELGQALDPGKQAYPNIRGLLCRAAGDNLVPPESEVGRTALERVKAAALLAAKIGWQSLMDQVGLDIAFEGADPRVLALLAARTQKIVGASIRARDRITDAIGTGIDKGESTSQIVERVHAVHREAYVGQAKVVAETEVGSVFGNARYVAMQEAGIGKSEWLTSRMSNVRPSHAAQDGEVRNLGEPFPNGLRWPQEPGAPPEESMNCHCVCLPVTS